MEPIRLKRNSRTGGSPLDKISSALDARGVAHSLVYNAYTPVFGYGATDVLDIDPNGQESKLTADEWRLLARGHAPEKVAK